MLKGVLDGKTMISMLSKFHHIFDLTHVFACVCYVHILRAQVRKLDARSMKGLFLGYSPTQNGYWCFVLRLESGTYQKMLLLCKKIPSLGHAP